MLRSLSLSLLSLLSCFWSVEAQRVCNNSPELCERRYNNVTYLGAHDSPFLRNAATGYSLFGNQYFDSPTQLDAGVRLLSGQVHRNVLSWDLCHSYCAFLDAGPLTLWLRSIKTWLDGHPNDVITILLVNSDNADAPTLHTQFQNANIVDYAYVPKSPLTQATNDWPTLNEMIDSNKRLVVWIANLDPANNTVAPYLLDQFTFVFENNYDISNPADFGCEPDRPSSLRDQPISAVLSSGYLPLMNHFLYNRINDAISIPAEDKVNNTNAIQGQTGNLGSHAQNCTNFYSGRPPTYILTDFFNVARAIDTVDLLNGVTNSVQGRKSLPDTVEGSRSVIPPVNDSMNLSVTTSPGTETGTGTGLVSSASPTPTTNSANGHLRLHHGLDTTTAWRSLVLGLTLALSLGLNVFVLI